MALAYETYLLPTAIAFTTLIYLLSARIKNRKLPPGPAGLPFFGNLFQLSTDPWKDLETWKEKYGPIVYLTAVGHQIVILNTHEAAVDLLDHRGSIYANRPHLVAVGEIFTGGMFLPAVQSGETFRKMRRAGHEALNKTKVIEYHPIQTKGAIIMIDSVLRDPKGWRDHFGVASTTTNLAIVYDLPPPKTSSDILVVKIERFFSVFRSAFLVHPVEIFPWMKRLPPQISNWKRKLEDRYDEYTNLFSGLFQGVEKQLNEGSERPSFTGTLIRERARHGLNDVVASWVAGTMYLAGYEATTIVLDWFVLAMIAFPEKQRKCHEELDRVIGRDRIPTFKDRDSLPYIQAAVREVLRWRPLAPLTPHATREDDFYAGYFIPKGTICLANVWSINRDTKVYGADADDFNPDRFINDHGQLSHSFADTRDGHMSYGFGPRICVGRHLANNSLFINIACLLWATNISPFTDRAGKPIIPALSFGDAEIVGVRPRPFEALITPRFPEAASIVAQIKELI